MGMNIRNLASVLGLEVNIPFDLQSRWPRNAFHFTEGKISPFPFQSDDVTKEQKVFAFYLPFSGVPGPLTPGAEEFDMNYGVFVIFLRVKRRELRFDVIREKFILFSHFISILAAKSLIALATYPGFVFLG